MPSLRPIRRVVTGNDAQGRSRVLYDSAAPNAHPQQDNPGVGMTELWVFKSCPAQVSGERDDGALPFHFEPPAGGGHLRIVQSPAKPANYDPAKDARAVPLHEPKELHPGAWFRGGANAFSSPIHKSKTLDYGIVLEGEKILILDDGRFVLHPGDVVVQQGTWHGWSNADSDTMMAFIMMGAR
jgi:mannose-6-phosphate isomerase-like protein (cupin superfamily)